MFSLTQPTSRLLYLHQCDCAFFVRVAAFPKENRNPLLRQAHDSPMQTGKSTFESEAGLARAAPSYNAFLAFAILNSCRNGFPWREKSNRW